jgi:hypothetical protein
MIRTQFRTRIHLLCLEGMQWNKHTKVFKFVSLSFKTKMVHLHKKAIKASFRSIKPRPPSLLLTTQLDQLNLILAWCSACLPLKSFREGIYISQLFFMPLHIMKNQKVKTKIELTINAWFISGKWLEAQ